MTPNLSQYDSHTTDILRRIVELAHETSKRPGTADDTPVPQNSRRMAKIMLQMAMSSLDSTDDQQVPVESFIARRLAEQKEKRRAEGTKGGSHAVREAQEREKYWEEEVERVRQSVERRMMEERELECEWQEAKYEAMRKRDEAELREMEQLARDTVRKAQDEAIRAQNQAKTALQEAREAKEEADRERQRADEAERGRMQQATRDEVDRQQLEEQLEFVAWSRYDSQWGLLRRIPAVVGGRDFLRFVDIPWPTVIPPTSPNMITSEEVAGFLFSGPTLDEGQTLKSRIKDCLLTWHPDKFSGRRVSHTDDRRLSGTNYLVPRNAT